METRKIKDNAGQEYAVNFQWDEKANVWIATSDDIKGLVLESESLDELVQRVMKAAPELTEMNRLPVRSAMRFSVDRAERMVLA